MIHVHHPATAAPHHLNSTSTAGSARSPSSPDTDFVFFKDCEPPPPPTFSMLPKRRGSAGGAAGDTGPSAGDCDAKDCETKDPRELSAKFVLVTNLSSRLGRRPDLLFSSSSRSPCAFSYLRKKKRRERGREIVFQKCARRQQFQKESNA